MGRLELPVGGRAATLFPPSFSRAYRGNGSKVMRVAQQQRGVVAARAGNLPLGLAYHGKRPGIPVTAVAPYYALLIKISPCEKMSAQGVLGWTRFCKGPRSNQLPRQAGGIAAIISRAAAASSSSTCTRMPPIAKA